MFSYQLINHPESFSLNLDRIEKIFQSVQENVPLAQNGILNIAFLPDEEIQKLNSEYRKINSTTDVLSFHYFEHFDEVKDEEIAGEIILSESKIQSQAKEHGHCEEDETLILILHGILHILGFDHETDKDFEKMWKYEKLLRSNCNLN